jgi:hypothetical protein
MEKAFGEKGELFLVVSIGFIFPYAKVSAVIEHEQIS